MSYSCRLTDAGIPDSLTKLSQLKAIGLKGNNLRLVPRVLGAMRSLQEIYLENNPYLEVPPHPPPPTPSPTPVPFPLTSPVGISLPRNCVQPLRHRGMIRQGSRVPTPGVSSPDLDE
jgi:Leucine-rich repeat (LRR) protein